MLASRAALPARAGTGAPRRVALSRPALVRSPVVVNALFGGKNDKEEAARKSLEASLCR